MSRQVWIRVCAAAVASVVVAAAVAFADGGGERFRVRDECDPTTFNSGPPTGPGAGIICNPVFDGDQTFAEFIDEVTADKQAEHWSLQPERTTVDRGERTSIESRGGEFHTFTKVAEFGGGILAGLNFLSGAGPTRPECGAENALAPPNQVDHIGVPDGKTVPGPSTALGSFKKGETTKWQCCIHPWMRSTITVR